MSCERCLAEAQAAIDGAPELHRLTIYVCDLCLSGAGGECHTPGCEFFVTAAPTGGFLEWLCRVAAITEEREHS